MRKMINRKIVLGAMLVAAAGVSACASLGALGGFAEPIVTVKDLRVRGLGLTGGSLDAYINVYNPNGFRLDATRLTYDVKVGENELGNGSLDSRFTVQDKDSTTVRIPIDFTYSGIGAAARQMAVSDSGSSDAPPTSAPSTSGCRSSSAALSGLTEPP